MNITKPKASASIRSVHSQISHCHCSLEENNSSQHYYKSTALAISKTPRQQGAMLNLYVSTDASQDHWTPLRSVVQGCTQSLGNERALQHIHMHSHGEQRCIDHPRHYEIDLLYNPTSADLSAVGDLSVASFNKDLDSIESRDEES